MTRDTKRIISVVPSGHGVIINFLGWIIPKQIELSEHEAISLRNQLCYEYGDPEQEEKIK